MLAETRRRKTGYEVKIAWATDIHLDFLQREGGRALVQFAFAEPLAAAKVDAVVISGDLSLSGMLEDHLRIIDETVKCPVYFVLGNHDFYGSSFGRVREIVAEVCRTSRNLRYLSLEKQPIEITPGLCIVGHDGWYDAYYGRPFTGGLVMSDWLQIEDYARHLHPGPGGTSIDPHGIVSVAREASFFAAEHVSELAAQAALKSKNVVVVTHVPPFPEAHALGGKGNNDASIPWYTSKLMGQAIVKVAEQHPHVDFTVLCGHTHHKAKVKNGKNVICFVGGSEYGEPSYNIVEVK
jgi:Icc-related predicted phosphoesterase